MPDDNNFKQLSCISQLPVYENVTLLLFAIIILRRKANCKGIIAHRRFLFYGGCPPPDRIIFIVLSFLFLPCYIAVSAVKIINRYRQCDTVFAKCQIYRA